MDQEITPLARDGVHEKVLEYLIKKPRGRILDTPTGRGALAKALHREQFVVSCCDIDPKQFMVKELKVDKGDLNGRIPYQDNEFDYICCIEGIEHTENPYNATRELARVIKPGGILILSTPNYLNIERRMKFLVTGFFTKPVLQRQVMDMPGLNPYGLHLSPIGYTLIKYALENAGFAIRNVIYDKKKKRQFFLKPIVWFIRIYARFWSSQKRERYLLKETTSDAILEGGNTLIIFAEKL